MRSGGRGGANEQPTQSPPSSTQGRTDERGRPRKRSPRRGYTKSTGTWQGSRRYFLQYWMLPLLLLLSLLQLRRSGRGEGTAAQVLRCFRGRGGASEPNGKRHQLRTKDERVGRGRGIPTGRAERAGGTSFIILCATITSITILLQLYRSGRGKEQPPKSSDAFVDVEEQTSPTKSVTNPRQKMNESAEEEESPQGVPNDRNVARQPEVLPCNIVCYHHYY